MTDIGVPARLKTGLGWRDAIENASIWGQTHIPLQCLIYVQDSQAQPVFKCCREGESHAARLSGKLKKVPVTFKCQFYTLNDYFVDVI